MKRLIIVTLAASVLATGCTTSASSDGVEANGVLSNGSVAKNPAATATRPRTTGAVTRDVTIPTGTTLHMTLTTAVASDTSRVEDPVTAQLTSPVIVGGRTVLAVGTEVTGIVSAADDSGRVKGRALLALDFNSLTSGGSRYRLSAVPFTSQAAATKGEDATKIGIGAGAGAVIGGIFGGKKGAAQGAAVGGGAGTGVVLATKGKEVRLASGADVSTQLSSALTVRLRN
jgi:hypothetical protein